MAGNCERCGRTIKERASLVNGRHYHVECFICDECKKPLGAEKYFIIKGKNYCMKDKNVSLLGRDRVAINRIYFRNSWRDARNAKH